MPMVLNSSLGARSGWPPTAHRLLPPAVISASASGHLSISQRSSQHPASSCQPSILHSTPTPAPGVQAKRDQAGAVPVEAAVHAAEHASRSLGRTLTAP